MSEQSLTSEYTTEQITLLGMIYEQMAGRFNPRELRGDKGTGNDIILTISQNDMNFILNLLNIKPTTKGTLIKRKFPSVTLPRYRYRIQSIEQLAKLFDPLGLSFQTVKSYFKPARGTIAEVEEKDLDPFTIDYNDRYERYEIVLGSAPMIARRKRYKRYITLVWTPNLWNITGRGELKVLFTYFSEINGWAF
eukprot:TRINITY_DN13032_c0_g1_i1.p1 TRINITY_DN13032_c0_g1~~TRINITY_DN13032_c0_g1_i1.p1  ORF type:complete len:193 (-),score=13.86 TRINITY_DN13032_c0_g1_i1:4-582(-)